MKQSNLHDEVANVNEDIKRVLDAGIYGAPELKPAEKALFLSTFRERVYIALTKRQVAQNNAYQEVINEMKRIRNGILYLNGDLSYSMLSKYIKEASKASVSFTIVNDKETDTPLGLVLASKQDAIEREEIFVRDDRFSLD
ncbi:YueI family protein [Guptibacillus hwajinpoensis]|uniref:YueI family protein n=1 Tax=Guptibacillus hwajinpoensis TaxID=208199 RepID=UPI001CFF5100|nr:YueI family protein [Pseudalkalibacillus hwajinpoensis]WLR58529.1 YueI family protein [Pseudalkalibacillus hwajinpoensis]